MFFESQASACGHKNFKRYKSCLKCRALIKEEEEKVVIFWDIKWTSGPARSDPIQIGLVKYYSGAVIDQKEINIFTENKIDDYCSQKSIRFTREERCSSRTAGACPMSCLRTELSKRLRPSHLAETIL